MNDINEITKLKSSFKDHEIFVTNLKLKLNVAIALFDMLF